MKTTPAGKLLLLMLFTLCMHSTAGAQQAPPQQGIITYDMAVQLRKQIAKKNPAMAALMPKEAHLELELSFSKGIFAVVAGATKAGAVSVPKSLRNRKRIVNLKMRSERTELTQADRKYFSEHAGGPAPSITYLAGTRLIAGYSCSPARVITADKKQHEVWYTEAIPYAYSPEGLGFAGLKGAVLEYRNDEVVCQASSVRPGGAGVASVITPDAQAKQISQDQMQALK